MYSVLESNWVPSLRRNKIDAFEKIKYLGVKSEATSKITESLVTYGSIQSFGMLKGGENILVMDRNFQTTNSERTADFRSESNF